MRLYLYENILYKLFRRDSALTLFHLSFLIIYLITNIGDAMHCVSTGSMFIPEPKLLIRIWHLVTTGKAESIGTHPGLKISTFFFGWFSV